MSAWENYHLEWSPDPLSVAIPTWQDITAFALARSGSPIHIQSGVPVMGSGAQAATMAVSLDDKDHRFTFGNTSSPLYPNWKPGRRIRCYETVGNRRVDPFSGYIQPPETDDWAESGTDQYVVLTAIDRLGRLGTARTMISTLAEYIMYAGGTSLVAYWPLLESGAGPFMPGPTTPQNGLYIVDVSRSVSTPQLASRTAITASIGGGAAVPGDDKGTLRFNPTTASGGYDLFPQVTGNFVPVTLTSGNTLTWSVWIYPEDPVPSQDIVPGGIGGPDGFQLQRLSGVWSVQFFLGAASPTVTFPGLTLNTWNLISMRYSLPSGLCEIWWNNVTSGFTTTVGSPPATSTVYQIYLGDPLQGNVGHYQIYNGTSFTAAAHVAQYKQGFAGLYGQTTGQRIRTLAQYAGIPAAELSLVDPGIAPMSAATLAGQTPLAEMRIAETTEQGRLRTNGQGLLVFDSRLRRYNS